jgi:AraC-like DNA-binding protein
MYERHHLMGKDFFQSNDIEIKILHRHPQPEYPIHTHDFSELVLVLNGHGTHFTQKYQFEVGMGDLFIINGDLGHGSKNLDNLVLINVLFDLEKLKLPEYDISRSPGFHTLFTIEPLLREDSRFSSRLKLDYKQISFISELLKDIEKEVEEKKEGYRYLCTSLFMQLVTYLSRIYSEKSDPEKSSLYQLGETISFLEHNLDRTVSIKELLDISHMSESSLLRAFKKITGTTPLGFHLEKRIDKACILLKESDKSITMIAFDTGFGDSNYFSRQFRKIRGESPREFKRRSNPRSVVYRPD